jgi:hypothetical protein
MFIIYITHIQRVYIPVNDILIQHQKEPNQNQDQNWVWFSELEWKLWPKVGAALIEKFFIKVKKHHYCIIPKCKLFGLLLVGSSMQIMGCLWVDMLCMDIMGVLWVGWIIYLSSNSQHEEKAEKTCHHAWEMI